MHFEIKNHNSVGILNVSANEGYCGMISTIYFHSVTQLVNLENRRWTLAEAVEEIQNDK